MRTTARRQTGGGFSRLRGGFGALVALVLASATLTTIGASPAESAQFSVNDWWIPGDQTSQAGSPESDPVGLTGSSTALAARNTVSVSSGGSVEQMSSIGLSLAATATAQADDHFHEHFEAPPNTGGPLDSGSGAWAGELTSAWDDCKPRRTARGVHSGFPLSPYRLPVAGTVKAAVLFVDFPDAPALETTQVRFAKHVPQARDYFDVQSNGRLRIETRALHQWIRMDKSWQAYDFGVAAADSGNIHRGQILEAVQKADPIFDFSDVDTVWVIAGGGQGPRINAALVAEDEGWGIPVEGGSKTIMNALTMGATIWSDPGPGFDVPENILVHEILHTLGLPDTYSYYNSVGESSYRFVGLFDPMGSVRGTYQRPDSSWVSSGFAGNELFAYHHWQIGWTEDHQVACNHGEHQEYELRSLRFNDGLKAIAAPLSDTKVLVVEARTMSRYDRDLYNGGVLVYTVDSAVGSGLGPVQVVGSVSAEFGDHKALLRPGESLEVFGHQITVLESVSGGFRIRFGQILCGGLVPTINLNFHDGPTGTPGDDVIVGTPGPDLIDAGPGHDVVCTLGGDDTINGGSGDDILLGGEGDDIIRGGDGVDRVRGQNGDDRIDGGPGNDNLNGNNGDDNVNGQDGNDYVSGSSGFDLVTGGAGNDTVYGGGMADVLRGGPGNDVLWGNAWRDRVEGGKGNDIMSGGDGPDHLLGGPGDDQLDGNRGNDILWGGNDTDTCNGRSGWDKQVNCEIVIDVP